MWGYNEMSSISDQSYTLDPREEQQTVPNPNLASYDEVILLPYIWGMKYNETTAKSLLKAENLHPFDLGRMAFFLLFDGYKKKNKKELLLGKKYLDFLSDSYPLIFQKDRIIVWKYPFQWGHLEAGWYSGMANSAIALAFMMGYQLFGKKKYKEMMFKAINGVVFPVDEGGSALSLGKDRTWFFEYVWDGINNQNAKFVLNGYLFSLLTVKIFADQTGNTYYQTSYRNGLNALKSLSQQFYYPSGSWTYYSLNPKVIESPHYALYDLELYNALYKLTGDSFFLKEIERRKKILHRNYPLIIYKDKDGSDKYLFSLIGPPHPYWIDIYPTKILFLSKEGIVLDIKKVSSPRDPSIPIVKRAFITGKLKPNAYKYEVYAEYNGWAFKWCEGLIKDCKREKIGFPYTPRYNLSCAYDAVCDKVLVTPDEGTPLIIIDPSRMTNPNNPQGYTNNQGRIIIDLPTPINRNKYLYWGLTIKPTQDVTGIALTFFDTDGHWTSRYYLPLKANVRNLLLLSWLGFKNVSKVGNFIKSIEITIYTNKLSKKFIIEIKGPIFFKNILEVYGYFMSHSFYFPEHLHHGNIY